MEMRAKMGSPVTLLFLSFLIWASVCSAQTSPTAPTPSTLPSGPPPATPPSTLPAVSPSPASPVTPPSTLPAVPPSPASPVTPPLLSPSVPPPTVAPAPAPVSPSPTPSSPPPPRFPPLFCFFDALRLRVCSDVLRSLERRGRPARRPCCDLIDRLSNQQAATCLCFAARNRLFGLRLEVPQDIVRLLTFCGRPVPAGLACP